MKILLFYLMFAIIFVGVTSCQNDIKDPIAPVIAEPTIKDGRLYFPSKDSYSTWAINVSKKSVDAQNRWAHSFEFKPLIDVVDESFSSPEIYKYLLNSDKQVRVGDKVIQIDGNVVTSVPYDNNHLLTLLKSDPDSDALFPYQKSAIRKIDALNSEVSTSTDPNARQNLTYRDIKYFYIGSIGGVGNFRFDFRIEEFCDGGIATMRYYNRIEYQSPRNGGWYQENYAQVDGFFAPANYSYRDNNNNLVSGTTPGFGYDNTPSNVNGLIAGSSTMGGTYNDFGYTPPFRVELDFSMRPRYNNAYGATWAGHAVFTNTF